MIISASVSPAQVATDGTYKIEQLVIAGGGMSADATGNVYSITGAIGQAVAGSGINNSLYSLQSGFFTAASLGTTAVAVTVGGRVMTNEGRGIRNVI